MESRGRNGERRPRREDRERGPHVSGDLSAREAELGVDGIGVPAKSYLGVPITVENRAIGVVSVQSTQQENRFGPDDVRLLTTIAASVGIAIQNARLHEQVQRHAPHDPSGATRARLLVGTSYGGGTVPRSNVVRSSDFLLMHGNGVKDPKRIAEMVRQTRAIPGYQPKPILFNEDDHYDFDKAEKKTGLDFTGPICVFKALDLGIALGSAVKTAMDLNIDNRIMYRIGTAAKRLNMLPEADVIMGVPLSAKGKSIYFDRR